MSNLEKLKSAQACRDMLSRKEASACEMTIAKVRIARQEMQVYISEIRRAMREEK